MAARGSARRRRPAYARGFQPGRNGDAIDCIGWPPAAPPAPHVLVLPHGSHPSEINWTLLRDACVFVTPPPGCRADADLLPELGRELAAAGARAVALFDGEHVVGEYWRDPSDRPEVHP